jgi:hypothetical protein
MANVDSWHRSQQLRVYINEAFRLVEDTHGSPVLSGN